MTDVPEGFDQEVYEQRIAQAVALGLGTQEEWHDSTISVIFALLFAPWLDCPEDDEIAGRLAQLGMVERWPEEDLPTGKKAWRITPLGVATFDGWDE